MKKKYMIWLLPLAIAIMIFCFSAQPSDESSRLSNGVILHLLGILSQLFPDRTTDEILEIMSTPIRKGAHISEYLVFNITIQLSMWVSLGWKKKRLVPAMIILFLYACTDEIHQLFVPGRAGLFTDVLIDCSGAFVLTLLILLWYNRKKQRIQASASDV